MLYYYCYYTLLLCLSETLNFSKVQKAFNDTVKFFIQGYTRNISNIHLCYKLCLRYLVPCIWQGRNITEKSNYRRSLPFHRMVLSCPFLFIFDPYCFRKRENLTMNICGFSYKYLQMASDVVCACSRLKKGGQARGNYAVSNESVILLLSDI